MTSQFRIVLQKLDLTKSAFAILSRILERTVVGSNDVLLTPVGKDHDPQQILSGWDKIYSDNLPLIDDPLRALEDKNRSKYGPRSIALPWVDRKDTVYDYYLSKRSSTKVNVPYTKSRRLRPLSLSRAITFLKNSTNSGLPYMNKKGKVKPDLANAYGQLLQRKDPCVMFTRTQENNKTRTVWGYPIADTTHEMMFYRPLFDYQSKLDWRSAITEPYRVDEQIIKLMKHARANNLKLVSIDFSSYDASIKRNLIESAFDYIKDLFQDVYGSELDEICERMITIGLVTPDGVLSGDHGVPSGSTFTNEVDSIVQYLIANDYSSELLHFSIQGDDGVYAVEDPDSFLAHFGTFGLNVNYDKTDVSLDHCLFLQKVYSYKYIESGITGGIYPTYRALCRYVYPERFVEFKEYLSGKDYFAIRALSILENCKYHPLFTKLIDYVLSLDKYSLIPSDQGIRGYVKFRESNDGKDVNFDSHNYGSSTSIKDFESYKYIKSKLT